ncbi:MAG TPA: hypothetical protein VGM08_01575 [Candidatus Saccharimonadales bacterium]|jgi:hypothetical protein
MEAVRRFYLRSWRILALGLSLALIAYLLYFQRLGSLLPGYSSSELTTYAGASNWHHIGSNPVNAPYKLVVWLFTAVLHHSIFVDRAVAAAIGVIAALLFFVVARAWCTYRVAFFATLMFATSSGLLHFARFGTGQILQMSILALLAVGILYRQQRDHRVIIGYLLLALFVLLWYIPGMFWFEMLALIPLWGTVSGQIRRANNFHLAGMLALCLLLVLPLVLAGIKHPTVLVHLSGLPQSLGSLSHIGSNLLELVLAITLRSNGSALFWVGHAPLLDAVEVITGLLGAYYVYREASGRTTFLFGAAAIGLLLASLGGSVTFACLVPIAYLFVALGLDQLLKRWTAVFPRNPVARLAGVSVILAMLAFSVLYQVRTYYIAWPHAPATRAAFNHRTT